jgi:hypothetical protein
MKVRSRSLALAAKAGIVAGAVVAWVAPTLAERGSTTVVSAPSGKSLTVKNAFGTTELVIDVTGYYGDQTQGQVEPNGILLDKRYTVLSSQKVSTGLYRITVDHPITACSIHAQSTVFPCYASVGTVSGSTFDIYVWRVISGTAPGCPASMPGPLEPTNSRRETSLRRPPPACSPAGPLPA